jgi:hypothetical protein
VGDDGSGSRSVDPDDDPAARAGPLALRCGGEVATWSILEGATQRCGEPKKGGGRGDQRLLKGTTVVEEMGRSWPRHGHVEAREEGGGQ